MDASGGAVWAARQDRRPTHPESLAEAVARGPRQAAETKLSDFAPPKAGKDSAAADNSH